MAARDLYPYAVEIDPPGGGTVVLGHDSLFPGVFPESLTAESDKWGPATLSFALRRPPNAAHPDLEPGVPVRFYVGGNGTVGTAHLRWSGRIRELPGSDTPDEWNGQVTCEGQGELDDDLWVQAWLLGRIQDWDDMRNSHRVDLNVSNPMRTWMDEGPAQAGDVTAYGTGATLLEIQIGTPIWGKQKVGVMIDLRRYPNMQSFFIEWYCTWPEDAGGWGSASWSGYGGGGVAGGGGGEG